MRGYFAIGIKGVSKRGNAGNLVRTAHGFGAAFVFAVDPHYSDRHKGTGPDIWTDTSKTADQVPFYEFGQIGEMQLPRGCALVGVEITSDAADLPSFRHPPRAAYIMGSERFDLDRETLARCDHVIKIPTQFSLNVATAGAIIMYDRLICLGGYPARPVRPGGPAEPIPDHVHGGPILRREKQKEKTDPR